MGLPYRLAIFCASRTAFSQVNARASSCGRCCRVSWFNICLSILSFNSLNLTIAHPYSFIHIKLILINQSTEPNLTYLLTSTESSAAFDSSFTGSFRTSEPIIRNSSSRKTYDGQQKVSQMMDSPFTDSMLSCCFMASAFSQQTSMTKI